MRASVRPMRPNPLIPMRFRFELDSIN